MDVKEGWKTAIVVAGIATGAWTLTILLVITAIVIRRLSRTADKNGVVWSFFQRMTVATLILNFFGILFRLAEHIVMLVYFPEALSTSSHFQRFVYNQGPTWTADSVLDNLGQLIQQAGLICYFIVLLERYRVFRFFLPFGRTPHFRLVVMVVGIFCFIFYYIRIVIVNVYQELTNPLRAIVVISRSLPASLVATFDLFLSIFLCRAAFQNSRNYCDPSEDLQDEVSSPDRIAATRHEQSRPSSPGELWMTGSLPRNAGSPARRSGSFSRTPMDARSFVSDTRTLNMHFPPTVNYFSDRSAEQSNFHIAEPATKHDRVSLTHVFRRKASRRSALLLIAAIFADCVAFLIYLAPLVLPSLSSVTRALEMLAICSVAIHYLIVLVLLESFKKVLSGGGGPPMLKFRSPLI
ncbi:hypothetical protein BJ742DRAFT_798189 [Cladochytrium replicatum]|nr:hypothetical protein BJ742DRAFT_798189 [Cladochytrium replicatum]